MLVFTHPEGNSFNAVVLDSLYLVTNAILVTCSHQHYRPDCHYFLATIHSVTISQNKYYMNIIKSSLLYILSMKISIGKHVRSIKYGQDEFKQGRFVMVVPKLVSLISTQHRRVIIFGFVSRVLLFGTLFLNRILRFS